MPNWISPHCVFVCCCQRLIQWPLCRELGVSSHSRALICMLSSLKTGTRHCKRFSFQPVISSHTVSRVCVSLWSFFSKQLRNASVWCTVSLLCFFQYLLKTRVFYNNLDSGWNNLKQEVSQAQLHRNKLRLLFFLLQQQHLYKFWQVAQRRWIYFALQWRQGSHFVGWWNAQTRQTKCCVFADIVSITWTWLVLRCQCYFVQPLCCYFQQLMALWPQCVRSLSEWEELCWHQAADVTQHSCLFCETKGNCRLESNQPQARANKCSWDVCLFCIIYFF